MIFSKNQSICINGVSFFKNILICFKDVSIFLLSVGVDVMKIDRPGKLNCIYLLIIDFLKI